MGAPAPHVGSVTILFDPSYTNGKRIIFKSTLHGDTRENGPGFFRADARVPEIVSKSRDSEGRNFTVVRLGTLITFNPCGKPFETISVNQEEGWRILDETVNTFCVRMFTVAERVEEEVPRDYFPDVCLFIKKLEMPNLHEIFPDRSRDITIHIGEIGQREGECSKIRGYPVSEVIFSQPGQDNRKFNCSWTPLRGFDTEKPPLPKEVCLLGIRDKSQRNRTLETMSRIFSNRTSLKTHDLAPPIPNPVPVPFPVPFPFPFPFAFPFPVPAAAAPPPGHSPT